MDFKAAVVFKTNKTRFGGAGGFRLQNGKTGQNMAATSYYGEVVAGEGFLLVAKQGLYPHSDVYELQPGGWALTYSSFCGWEHAGEYYVLHCSTREQVVVAVAAGWDFDVRSLNLSDDVETRKVAMGALRLRKPLLEQYTVHTLTPAYHVGCNDIELGEALALSEPERSVSVKDGSRRPDQWTIDFCHDDQELLEAFWPKKTVSYAPEYVYCARCGQVVSVGDCRSAKRLARGMEIPTLGK